MARLAALLAVVAFAATAASMPLSALGARLDDALPPNATSLTYGQLAAIVVPPAWDNVISLLPTLSCSAMPGDVKPVRKAILALRNLMDVFSYAYPISSPTFKGDPLPYIRDLLDQGYELIGHFRDLQESGVNYTKKELVTRRSSCLIWEADFEEKSASHQIEAYLDAPLLTQLEKDRPASHLSSFFWRNTGFVPKKSDTGLHSVVKLTKALLQLAQAAYGPLIKLDDLTEEAQQTQMHDARKQLRGILAIGSVLPVWNDTAECEEAVATLTMAYDGLGKVEDSINAYIFAEEHGSKGEKSQAAEVLAEKWDALVEQLKDADLEGAEGTLIDSLIHY